MDWITIPTGMKIYDAVKCQGETTKHLCSESLKLICVLVKQKYVIKHFILMNYVIYYFGYRFNLFQVLKFLHIFYIKLLF